MKQMQRDLEAQADRRKLLKKKELVNATYDWMRKAAKSIAAQIEGMSTEQRDHIIV